jgi:transcriptional regulator with XRE-family HTH domain
MRQSLGGSLRHHRAVLGLTQNALARRAGVSQAYLSQVEAGRRVRVSATILLQLADALGVTVTDLMGKAALAIPRATRSEAWLYQMSQRPAWGRWTMLVTSVRAACSRATGTKRRQAGSSGYMAPCPRPGTSSSSSGRPPTPIGRASPDSA